MGKVTKGVKGWIIHLSIVIAMYSYYLYLWEDFIFYDGKAGWKGFGLFINTLATAPFYIIFHLAVFFISKSAKSKNNSIIGLTGLLLCFIHVCAVLLQM